MKIARRSYRIGFATRIALSALHLGEIVLPGVAEAQVVRHRTQGSDMPRRQIEPRAVRPDSSVHRHGFVVDRGRPGWWRGQPDFSRYFGPRPGRYFAPGYGYYPRPPRGIDGTWVVGGTLIPAMRRYMVVTPALYGLAAAPAGYGWYFAGTSMVLIVRSTGVIVQSVAGGW